VFIVERLISPKFQCFCFENFTFQLDVIFVFVVYRSHIFFYILVYVLFKLWWLQWLFEY
jgi:hypothetical protein